MEGFASVAQAATQTTPENERVSFATSCKSKNKTPLKLRSNSKNGMKSDSVDSPEPKDSLEVVIQEPKYVNSNAIYSMYSYCVIC